MSFKPIDLYDVITFGKYGKSTKKVNFQEMVNCDIKYVTWFVEDAKIEITNAAFEYYKLVKERS